MLSSLHNPVPSKVASAMAANEPISDALPKTVGHVVQDPVDAQLERRPFRLKLELGKSDTGNLQLIFPDEGLGAGSEQVDGL